MGGGTLIAVKSNLSSRVVLTAPISLECIAVEVDLSSSLTALFINCYRPPNGNKDFNHNLKTLLDTLNLEKYWGVFLLGNFNYPNINWIDGSGFTNSISSDDQCFANLMIYRLSNRDHRMLRLAFHLTTTQLFFTSTCY
jgi:hypothetical protein